MLSVLTFGQFDFGGGQADLKVHVSHKNIHKLNELTVVLEVNVHEGWHINSNVPKDEFLIPTTVTIDSNDVFNFSLVKFPEAHDFQFAFSENPVSVFEGKIYLGGKIQVPANVELGKHSLNISLNYQACNNEACMPPTTISEKINFEVAADSEKEVTNPDDVFSKVDLSYGSVTEEGGSLAEQLESSGLLISLLIVFVGGLALNLTPCVYPLIPITIGYFGGQSEGSTQKLFFLGLFYILGMALTYSVVGVVTSLSGALFGTLMQNPIVIIVIALIFIALALSMFGMYELKMPDKLVMQAGGAKSGVFGAFFMGLTMGIVAAPCIGPFVLGLVTYVGAKGDPFYGFIMFFTLAIGLGLPYLFLALFSGKLNSLPRAGMWMEAVKHIFGFLLFGMAFYFAAPLFPKVVNIYLIPVFMVIAGAYLLFIDKLANDIKGFRIFKSIFSVTIIVLGIYFLIPTEKKAPEWIKFSKNGYEQALSSNEVMIIDCYADWCIACKELDALTFSNDSVIAESKKFKMLKVDMTVAGSEISEYARNQFDIKGLPTVIFVGSDGKEVSRITGFVNAEEFKKIMNEVK
ncbi:MAG: thioredoxin family protein [Melioribacteraceae bacterium]|nr:thioredoxin family protein [Melioribacteraceae bacterium]